MNTMKIIHTNTFNVALTLNIVFNIALMNIKFHTQLLSCIQYHLLYTVLNITHTHTHKKVRNASVNKMNIIHSNTLKIISSAEQKKNITYPKQE